MKIVIETPRGIFSKNAQNMAEGARFYLNHPDQTQCSLIPERGEAQWDDHKWVAATRAEARRQFYADSPRLKEKGEPGCGYAGPDFF